MRLLVVLVGILIAAPTDMAAQGSEAEVVRVVQRMFDAMRTKDTTALRSLFHGDARLMSTGFDETGRPYVRRLLVDRFVTVIGGSASRLDEQVWNIELRVDDNLATAWMPFALYVDGRFSHCGVNSFQFARVDGAWKIIHIADTRRDADCAKDGGVKG